MVVLHMIKEEDWSHVNPNVSTFRVFGSLSWTLILDEKHKAMEKRRQPLIYVCY
jgi:hypothetical protein